jgi:hypothetical protein
MFTGVRHCCRGSIYLQVTGVAVGVSIYTGDKCCCRDKYIYRCQVAVESVYL